MRVKVGIMISGRGSNMAAIIAAARAPDCPYEVALVVADRLDTAGIRLAEAHRIATFAQVARGRAKAEFEAAVDAAMREHGVEVIALAGYMRLVSDDFVARWRGRMLNIHPSLLPLYKGLDTHARAIAAGDSHGGCSVHLVTEELDGGEVLGQARVPILRSDTPDRLAERVLEAEHLLYPKVLAEFVSDESRLSRRS